MTFRQKCVAAFVATAVLGASGLMLSAQAPQAVGTWAPAGELAEIQSGGVAVALEDGRTLIVGGSGADGAPTDRVVIVSPWDNSFFVAGRLLAARVGHTATLLADGRVFVAGGRVDGALVADVELFSVVTGASEIVGALAQARAGHAAARLADGTVLIVGGVTVDGAVVATAESFDPATSSTAPLSSGLQSPRAGASATPLVDGRVLVAGGYNGTTDLGSAEIYHPATQTFSLLDSQLSVARSGHTAVLLPNNNSVLVAGGWSNGVPQTVADLFVPAEFPDPYSYGTGSFVSTAAMSAARAGAVGGPGHAEGFAFVTGGGSQSQERYRFATIRTDKDDYAPGERAVISGTGWQPGEDVTLVFQEDPAVHDDYVLTVTADAAGDIYWDQWAPEEHDLNVRFYLMARDSVSRAQITFTDGGASLGSISVGPQLPDPVPQGNSAIYVVTINRAASGQGVPGSFTVLLSLTTTLPTGVTASFSPNPVTIAGNVNTGTSTLTLSTSAATPVNPVGTPFTVLAVNQAGGGSNTATTTGSLRVSSGNSAPTVAFTAGPASVTESGTAEHAYTFSITDPDAGDSWTFASGYPTCGTGGNLVAGSATINNTAKTGAYKCTFPDGQANPTLAVKVEDAGAASNEATSGVAVANVAPTVTFGAGPATVDESSATEHTYSYSISDPGDDTVSLVTTSCGANGTKVEGSDSNDNASGTFKCKFLDGPANSTVSVQATDSDASSGNTAEQVVTANNVAPTVTFTAGPTTVAESGVTEHTYSYSISDPGDDTTGTVTTNCGASGTKVGGSDSNDNTSGTFKCKFLDGPANSTVSAQATDSDTAASNTAEQVVTVSNVAPTVTLTSGPTTVDESGVTEHTYSYSVSDPGDDTVSTVTTSCGANGTKVGGSDSNDNTSGSFKCKFLDGPANSTISTRATDSDGATGNIAERAVTVSNVAPTVSAGVDATLNEGSLFSQNGSFADPGLDSATAVVNYGDASGNMPLALNPDNTFSLAHAYGDNGTFTVTVTVTDDDGGVGTDTVTVTVRNVVPDVAGSTFTFNPYTGAASAAVNFSDPGWLDTVSPSFNWGGNLTAGLPAVSGPGSAPAVTGTFTSSYTFAPGCITGGMSVAVTDDDLGVASVTFADTNSLQVYSVAFLAPLKDGVRNVVRLGNVIPVKLSIRDCHGNPVTDKTLSIVVAAGIFNSGDVVDGAEVIPTSVSAADNTGLMRLADGHYMYNLGTKGLSTGLPYTIIIRAGAQVVATAVVEAKK